MKKSNGWRMYFYILLVTLTSCGEGIFVENSEDIESWEANLKIENLMVNGFASSTKLALSWDRSEVGDSYRVVYVDQVSGSEYVTETRATELILENLKAGTEYAVKVLNCVDSFCIDMYYSEQVSKKTAEEYWQIQGNGDSYTEATHLVLDGNTLAQISWLGIDTLKMYYNPGFMKTFGMSAYQTFQSQWRGVRIAVADEEEGTFTSTDSGIKNICLLNRGKEDSSCPEGALYVSASQAVPIKTDSEAFVRLFFEATETKAPYLTKNYYLDSQDGLIGEDFNPSENSTVCGDRGLGVAMGGECEPTLFIDENDGLKNSRQAKVALPLLDSLYWDLQPGTFMIVTGEDTCEATRDGLFYAQWDGTDWRMAEDEEGCARPLALMGHGPVVLHLGEDNYKVYYEQYTSSTDFTQKPLKMFYTDGNDFEDFESYETARDVHFLWPDGSALTAQEESGLGDHFIYLPTHDILVQYMALNLGGMDDDSPKEGSTGIGLAILMNP